MAVCRRVEHHLVDERSRYALEVSEAYADGLVSDEVLAVKAYVQIVNAYVAMNQLGPAGMAAERGRWILKRIPDEAFIKTAAAGGRDYYERLLALGKN